MNKNSPNYGRPAVVSKYSTQAGGEDHNTTGICPSSMGSKNQQPAAFSPDTGLFYVPVTNLCMDYEPFKVSYAAGQPYVGATLAMYPPGGESNLGNFIAWDAKTGKIVWSKKEQFAVWSGALATAGGVVFYGTLEGYLKAVDANTGRELYKYKTQSGIVGNVMTYQHGGKQYVAVLSGGRRLGRHWSGSRSHRPACRLRCGGRIRSAWQLYIARRSTHRVRAAVTFPNPTVVSW
jgi:lanthanide-dependent methanol dehydrogenase